MRHFLLSILILIPASASADALVTMRADGSLGAIGSIYQNGVFSGLASDVIEITGDEAQFDLKFDGGYEVSLAVSIERGGLQVSAPVFGDHSRSRSVKELSAPISVEVDGDRTLDAFFSVKLDVPGIRDTGRARVIAAPLRFASRQKAAIVSFETDPPGAEIWVDGDRLKFPTDVTLSIPFLTYDDTDYRTKSVVLRMPGYVNARREISLDSRTLSIALETPEVWHARNSGRAAQ